MQTHYKVLLNERHSPPVFQPCLYRMHMNPTNFYRNYYQTYVERDVRQISAIRDAAAFGVFMKLLAGRVSRPNCPPVRPRWRYRCEYNDTQRVAERARSIISHVSFTPIL